MRSFTGKERFFPIRMVVEKVTYKCFPVLMAFLFAMGAGPFPVFSAEGTNLQDLAKTLADQKADTLLRMEAARKLGESKDGKYLEALTAALKDNNKSIRWVAAEALWEMGDKRAVPALIEYLEKEDAYEWGKVITMNALASFKDPQAVDPLIKMLEAKNPFLRRSAALALAKIGDQKAVPALIGLLKDEEGWLQRLAQNLLEELAKENISGETPMGYQEWIKWYQGRPQPVKIEGVKKE